MALDKVSGVRYGKRCVDTEGKESVGLDEKQRHFVCIVAFALDKLD